MTAAPIERERKFLVSDPAIIAGLPGTKFLQGYLVVTGAVELRVRTGRAGQTITIKGSPNETTDRVEEEFVLQDRNLAYALVEACDGRVLVKTRYVKYVEIDTSHVDMWTIDEYHGDNQGLLIAEYEYAEGVSLAAQIHIPTWVGREVTTEYLFYGQALSVHPLREWSDSEREKLT